QGSAVPGTCRTPSLAPLTARGAVTGTTIAALSNNSPMPCGANPTLRLTLTNSNAAEFWTFPKDTSNRYEPGGSLGGPIVHNRMWFFGGYQPALTTVKRTANAATSGNVSAASISQTQHQQVQYVTADQTTQLGSKLRTRVAFNNSWSKTNGQLPALSGVDPVTTNYARGTVSPNWSLSGVADYNVTSNFLLGFRA